MSDRVFVSYITHTHPISGNTPLGSVLVNYLIDTRSSPTANVVFPRIGGYESFYSFDLNEPVDNIGANFSISKDNFVSINDKLYAMRNLRAFLIGLGELNYEDTRLLELTEEAIEKIELTEEIEVLEEEELEAFPIVEPVYRPSRSVPTVRPLVKPIQTGVRDSLISRTKVTQRSPTITGVATSPVSRRIVTKKLRDDSSSSTTEDEIEEKITRKSKRKSNRK